MSKVLFALCVGAALVAGANGSVQVGSGIVSCNVGEVFCCDPANPVNADSSMSYTQMEGCVDALSNTCSAKLDPQNMGEFQTNYCGCGLETSNLHWTYDCDSNMCKGRMNSETTITGMFATNKALCSLMDDLQGAVTGLFALGTGILVAIVAGFILIVSLIIYCCCCRKSSKTIVITPHPQQVEQK